MNNKNPKVGTQVKNDILHENKANQICPWTI